MKIELPVESLRVKIHHLWNTQWLLLTAGDLRNGFNPMTVSWGSMGTLWNKPFVQVFVRPTRHTYGFMERFDTFTLSAFPEKYRSILELLGTVSGKEGDKIERSGLRPIPCPKVEAPGYEEAELILGCRKMYWDDLKPEHFLLPETENHYPGKDYHRIHFGEVLSILAEPEYGSME